MGKLDEYVRQIQMEQEGIKPLSPGEIPSYEQASAYFGWNRQPQYDDSVSQLMSGIMQTQKNPYGTVSDDMRQWYSAATDYAEKLGYWPQWGVLEGIGVPIGQPYKPADLSDVIGMSDKYTAPMFGIEAGQPVTQNMFNQVQGSTDFQTMSDEAKRYDQIMQIMKATNYDSQTAAFIYDTFLNDAGFEGGSAWAKGTYTPDEWRTKLEKMPGIENADPDAMNEFYQTVPEYKQLRSFDEWAGVTNTLSNGILKEGIERNKGVNIGDGPNTNSYTNQSTRSNYINLDYLHNNYFPQAVDIVNTIAQNLREKGDISTLIRFIRESGIDQNDTFSIDESLKALKWLSDNGQKDAQDLWNNIMNDTKIYRPVNMNMTAVGVL